MRNLHFTSRRPAQTCLPFFVNGNPTHLPCPDLASVLPFIFIPAGTGYCCTCRKNYKAQDTPHHTTPQTQYHVSSRLTCCRCPSFLSAMTRTTSPSYGKASPLQLLRRKALAVTPQTWELFRSKHQGLRRVSRIMHPVRIPNCHAKVHSLSVSVAERALLAWYIVYCTIVGR